VKNKTVVDIASGEGYGASIVAEVANQVIGIDLDESAVFFAKEKYKKENLTFLVGRADNIPIESKSVDVVISFETIEHHDKHDEMFSEIKRILKPEGILIMSSPDKKYYSDLRNKVNAFHVKELYLNEFKELTKKYFKNVTIYFQKSINGNSTIGEEKTFNNTTVFSGNYESIIEQEVTPLYNIAIASDMGFKLLGYSIFNGEEISQTIFKVAIDKILSSITFRVGKFLLFPFFWLKKRLKNNL
jgi:ubiquinone/menaquinone biosynthesis C-methylase UbiE